MLNTTCTLRTMWTLCKFVDASPLKSQLRRRAAGVRSLTERRGSHGLRTVERVRRPSRSMRPCSRHALQNSRTALTMASTPAQQQQQHVDWASGLPLELLQRCLGRLDDQRAAFRTCKRLARAVLLNSLQQEEPGGLRLDVDRDEPVGPSAQLFQALVGDALQQPGGKGFTLVLHSDSDSGPEECLAQLEASGAVLACIARLELQGLELGSLVPNGVHAQLPNLRQLRISQCQLTADAADSLVDASCARLQHVEVEGLNATTPLHQTVQLQQLAGLPQLSSISLLDSACPTTFLGHLSTRLTALHLAKSYRQVRTGTQTATAAWRATLQHTARCTQLQSLTIPCVTSEELGVVAPALQRLQRLRLIGLQAAVDGDALVDQLLALPHLTSLRWDEGHKHAFRRCHASRPCRWKDLKARVATPHQLSHLPLHSLTSPVAWEVLSLLERRASVREVQAAAANVARCPAGGRWWPDPGNWPTLSFMPAQISRTFTRGAGEGDTPVALLRALQPLLAQPGLRKVCVAYLAWDAELVQVLGQVLPRTCVELCLRDGEMELQACVQLAKSLPWLANLELRRMSLVPPQAVSAYIGSVVAFPEALLPSGRPRLREVDVTRPGRPGGVSEEAHRREWEQVQQVVEGLGVEFTLDWDE